MKTCPRCGNTNLGKTKTGYACHGCYSWFDEHRSSNWIVWLLVALAFLLPLLGFGQSPAKLRIEQRGGEVFLYVTGGTSNVQYEIWTSPQNTADLTNGYYWRRAYSSDFHPYAEILVNGSNTTYRAQRFFQIRGILPD